MKIKRVFAPEIRQAIRQVREALGPDAVILSNRNVDGGVEIVAALDLDVPLLEAGCQAQHREPRAAPRPAGRADGASPPDAKIRSHEPSQASVRSSPNRGGSAPARPYAGAASPALRAASPAPDPIMLEMRSELKGLRELFNQYLSCGMPNGVAGSRSDLLGKLADLGFGGTLAAEVAGQLGALGDPGKALEKALGGIIERLPLLGHDPVDAGGIIALVGPTGVGKTTTLAKLASHHVLRHGCGGLGLVTVDSYRIAAHEQLRTYGRLLNVPVRVAADSEELRRVLDDFGNKRLVLIDTAGMSQRDTRLAEQLAMLRDGELPIQLYLAVSTTTQTRAMAQVFQAFGVYGPKACILTKLDEAASYGGAICALIEHRLPLAYLCNGQRVPEDLHVARREKVLALCGQDSGGDFNTGAEAFSNAYRMAQAYA